MANQYTNRNQLLAVTLIGLIAAISCSQAKADIVSDATRDIEAIIASLPTAAQREGCRMAFVTHRNVAPADVPGAEQRKGAMACLRIIAPRLIAASQQQAARIAADIQRNGVREPYRMGGCVRGSFTGRTYTRGFCW